MHSQVSNFFRVIIYLVIFGVVFPIGWDGVSRMAWAQIDVNNIISGGVKGGEGGRNAAEVLGLDKDTQDKWGFWGCVSGLLISSLSEYEKKLIQDKIEEADKLCYDFIIKKDSKGASKSYAILQELQKRRGIFANDPNKDPRFLLLLKSVQPWVAVENVETMTEEYDQSREPSILTTVRHYITQLQNEYLDIPQIQERLNQSVVRLNKIEAEDIKRQATFNNAMAIVEEKLKNKTLDENDLEIVQKNMEIARENMRTKAERARFERVEGDFLIVKHFYSKNNIERSPGERVVLTLGNIEFAFRWAPPGTFLMGSPEDEIGRRDDEQLHKVKITRGFWILEGEITQAMYELCFPGTTATKPWFRINNKQLIDYATSEGGKTIDKLSTIKHNKVPMENVDWGEAVEYCNIFNARFNPSKRGSFKLPTEAQWELACRAGETGAFSVERKNVIVKQRDTGLNYTHYKRPNAWGVYDMPGSVAEWTSDWYRKYPEYKNETAVDPKGPESPIIVERVSRGGCWSDKTTKDCRSAARRPAKPEGVADTGSGYDPGTFGFRIIFDPYDWSEASSGAPGVMEDEWKEVKNTGNGRF